MELKTVALILNIIKILLGITVLVLVLLAMLGIINLEELLFWWIP